MLSALILIFREIGPILRTLVGLPGASIRRTGAGLSGHRRLALFRDETMQNRPIQRSCWSVAGLSALLAGASALAGPADKVYYPVVERGEREIELRSGVFKTDESYQRAFVLDVGYSPSDHWTTELVGVYEGESGSGGEWEELEWENILTFAEPGEHALDVGLLAEYEHKLEDGADAIIVGPLLQKEFPSLIANLNLLFERQIGSDASDDTALNYAWELKWRGDAALEFGVQGFGEYGDVSELGAYSEHRIGPAVFSTRRLASGNKFSWDAALLAGIDDDAPDAALRVQFDYEIY